MALLRQRYHHCILPLALFLIFIQAVRGYPTGKFEPDLQPDEKLYPNGTVVGKYAYYDKEGNPVEVKYYADEASYGVELSSVKMSKKNGKAFSTQMPGHPTEETPETLKNIPTGELGQFDVLDSFKYPAPTQYKTLESQIINKEVSQSGMYKNKYKNPDYEVYMQNNVNAPNKRCNSDNEKVRIYKFDKGSKVQDTPVHEDMEPKFCERY